MRRRVSEHWDDLKHFDEAAGPAVSQHERDWRGSPTGFMDEVNSVLVNLRYKLGK
jgi:hypothetical protein